MEELTYERSFKTPVQRAFYESFLLRSRYNVARLYALNVAASSKYKKEVKHLGHERKTNLKRLDSNIDQMRYDLGRLELAKGQVSYLPTEQQELELPKCAVQVEIEENRRMTMHAPPPVFLAYIQSFEKKVEKSPKTRRKPLHLPKYTRPRLREISKTIRDVLSTTSGRSKSVSSLSSRSFNNSPTSILKSREPKSPNNRNYDQRNTQTSCTLLNKDVTGYSISNLNTPSSSSSSTKNMQAIDNLEINKENKEHIEHLADDSIENKDESNSIQHKINYEKVFVDKPREKSNPEFRSSSALSNRGMTALDTVEEEEVEKESNDEDVQLENIEKQHLTKPWSVPNGYSHEYKLTMKEMREIGTMPQSQDASQTAMKVIDIDQHKSSSTYKENSDSVHNPVKPERMIKWNDQSLLSKRAISDSKKTGSTFRKYSTPVNPLRTSSPITATPRAYNRRYSSPVRPISTPSRKYSITDRETPRKYSIIDRETPRKYSLASRTISSSTQRRRFSSVNYNEFYEQCDFNDTDAKFITRSGATP